MPPSRRWIEVIFCVINELDDVRDRAVIHKVPSLPMNEFIGQTNWKCSLRLLSLNNDNDVQQFVEKALPQHYSDIQKKMLDLLNDQCQRRQNRYVCSLF